MIRFEKFSRILFHAGAPEIKQGAEGNLLSFSTFQKVGVTRFELATTRPPDVQSVALIYLFTNTYNIVSIIGVVIGVALLLALYLKHS